MVSRSDLVREKLEQMIVEGSFAQGERLDEIKLSQHFDVSRTPLREAFQALAASGLLVLEPRRGAFVRYPALEEVFEMFEVMAELEAFCCRLAAGRVTQPLLADLDKTMVDCKQAVDSGDVSHYYRANERFHALIYQASGNRFLEGEATRLHRRLKPFRRLQLNNRGRLAHSFAEHGRIIDALAKGDAQAAAIEMRAHIAIQGGKFNDLIVSYRQAARKVTGEDGVSTRAQTALGL
ncbi:GntR family transcriptional regulator [Tianweitania sp. BSSL-BM11]|uniref:GntR family transcriptional regulator n=1 Tax=Tianweitania aestuarii TaxID=2814886 RepID=A0ABS5S0L5_9HYPH|nr:GntR family transcriptional regulator [Tianweitania aestuarii]MBS9722009.1 GntR family transcriptional regulator [Tianweitania aestuarii]